MRRALVLAALAAMGIGASCHLVAGIEDGTAACPVDGVRNGLEVDVDCGGACPPCADGARCEVPEDCASNSCGDPYCTTAACATNKHCRPADCDDFRTNGGETDEDCGGPSDDCDRCTGGDACRVDDDCAKDQTDGPTCVDGRCLSGCCNEDCGTECCPADDEECCDACPPGGLGSMCDSEDGPYCNDPLQCFDYEGPTEVCF